MQTKTPFLTGFPTLLSGSAKRKNQDIVASDFQSLQLKDGGELSQQLHHEIPAQLLADHTESARERIYTDIVVFWAFLGQVLSDDKSCKKAVSRVKQWLRRKGKPEPSSATTSYCNARMRLPVDMLQAVNTHLYDQLDRELPRDSLWRGFSIFAEDGTSVQAPDTEANQKEFPQPSTQADGCGFPVVGLVGLVSLGHGGLRDFSCDEVNGSEHKGHQENLVHLGKGDLLIGDRLYSSYEIITTLQQKEVAYIGRPHPGRKVDFRKGKKIAKNQRIITLDKPRQQTSSSLLSKEQWADLPDQVEVRLVRTYGPDRDGKKRKLYVITTLLDPIEYPSEEILSLYAHRWEIELNFRDIKTTMKMEMLRTKSPDLVKKEILMFMIAYNSIRLLMLKAGNVAGVNHRRISFKATIQVLEESKVNFVDIACHPRLLKNQRQALLSEIADHVVKARPGRNEPRKKKLRPKPYGWLQKPRHHYFEHFTDENPPAKILDRCS